MKLGTYQRLMAVQDDESISDREKSLRYISILRDIDPRDIRKMTVGKIEKIANEVTEEMTSITENPIRDTYTVDGIECRLMRTMNDMTAIQFSDLTTVTRRGDIEKNLHTILSILLVPIKNEKGQDVDRYLHNYNRLDLEEKIMADFEIADGMAIANFCRGLSIVSSRGIVTSLILTQANAWMGVPKWRRVLARRIVMALLIPSRKLLGRGGVLSSGSTRSRTSKIAHGRKQSGSTSSNSSIQ